MVEAHCRRRALGVVLAPFVLVVAACTSGLDGAGTTSESSGTTIPPVSAGEVSTTTTEPQRVVPDPDPDPTRFDADAAVTTGQLDNGVRYLIRENDSPGGALELRLAIRAGSLHQSDPGDGSAHVLEHMAFNGTESFPGNSLDDRLAAVGAAIGPHLNAYTSFDETVYQLSIPASDEAIDLAFTALAEWAGALRLDPDEVEAELPVVLEELRLSESSPRAPIQNASTEAYLGHTAYAGHDPIGRADLVADLDVATLRRFYDDWYRPDRMTVVAVGDVDPAEVEAMIVEAFGGLTDRGAGPELVEPSPPLPTEPVIRVVEAPDTTTSFTSVDWMLPAWDGSTVGGERLLLIEELLFAIVRTRLDDASLRGTNDLLVVGGGRFGVTRTVAAGGFYAEADDLADATRVVVEAFRSTAAGQLDRDELDRTVAAFRTAIESELDTIDSVQDAELADALVEVAIGRGDPSSAPDRVARLGALLDDIDIDELVQHAAWIDSVSAPIVVVAGPSADDLPDEADLRRALDAAVGAAGSSDGATAAPAALATVAEPVAPLSTRDLGDDAVEWTFANGVVVRHRFSTIASDRFSLVAASPGGARTMPDWSLGALDTATDAMAGSGVGSFDPVQLDTFLAGRTVGLGPFINDAAEGFGGSASPDDAELLFQLLHASIDGPRVDPVPLARALDAAAEAFDAVQIDPTAAAITTAHRLSLGEDPAWRLLPTPAELDALDLETAAALVTERLGHIDGGLTVVVVGDIARERVESLAARYLGTLSAGAEVDGDPEARPLPAPLDSNVSERLRIGSDAEGAAQLVLTWRTVDPDRTASGQADRMLLEGVLADLIFERIREELGATYGGRASIDLQAFDDTAAVWIVVQGDPDRIDEIRDEAVAIVDELAAVGPDADTLERARVLARRELDLVNNPELVDRLFAVDEPDVQLEPADIVGPLRTRTAADLAAAVRRLLPDGQRVEVIVEPDR